MVSLCLVLAAAAQAQQREKPIIRVDGLVMDVDSQKEMPFVNVYMKGSSIGTVSDTNGHFSLLLHEGDTLVFSNVGYQNGVFIMPANLDHDVYAVVQLMRKNTVVLDEVVVFPWPDINNFKEAFLDEKPPRNFDDMGFEVQRDIKRLSEEDYQRNKYYYEQMRYNKMYDMHGIIPPNNFMNPFYWSNFVRDIKSDKRKKKK